MNDSKSIRELLEMGIRGEFCKLDYQRRYEWNTKNILSLLETLNDGRFTIGEARVNIISPDNNIYKQCIPLEYMDNYPLNPTKPLWALVDFQQRLTTLLMFYNNHPKVENIQYSISENKFIVSRQRKQRLIPVQALFNLTAKIEWSIGKDFEVIQILEALYDKFNQTTVNIEIHHDLSIEDQAKWFLLLNGTGRKVTQSHTTSAHAFMVNGVSLNQVAEDIENILKAQGITLDDLRIRDRYKLTTLTSLLLPFTDELYKISSVPTGGNVYKMHVKNIEKVKPHAYELITKSAMFLSKNIELKGAIQFQAFIYFLSQVEYALFEYTLAENDAFFELVKFQINNVNNNSIGSHRAIEIKRVAELLKKELENITKGDQLKL